MADRMNDERANQKALLDLSRVETPEELVKHAARLVARLTGARETYVELFGDELEGTTFSAAEGCDVDRLQQIRGVVSRGIVAEAIATGQTVITASALADPRFAQLDSVRALSIDAVLCTPIGAEGPLGVLYAQGRSAGLPSAVFDAEDRRWIEMVAAQLAPIAIALMSRGRTAAIHEPERTGTLDRLVLRNKAYRHTIERLKNAAPLDVHLLLTGPSGVGKTMLAQAVHAASGRAQRAFVELNCAAIPEQLLENELFGADPGAHSTALRRGVPGKVEAAEGGTLFLDEVAELSLSAQAKLLQLLQSKTYFRLGASQPRRADIRVIAATNASLSERVRDKTFRDDLYYRINVLQVRIPALTEREEDVVPLAIQLCREACLRHDLPIVRLSPAAVRAIRVAPWPGNVRELAHRIEAAVVNAHLRSASVVEVADLFGDGTAPVGSELSQTLQDATRRFQKQHVAAVLESMDWNVTEAARHLDIVRSHLYNLIRALDLKRNS